MEFTNHYLKVEKEKIKGREREGEKGKKEPRDGGRKAEGVGEREKAS